MNAASAHFRTKAPLGDHGAPPAPASDRLARELNDQVIGHLSRASVGLIALASALPDASLASRLLDCVAQIDAASTRIRAVAFGDLTSGAAAEPLHYKLNWSDADQG